jgi:hypothetical protein
LLTPIRNLEKLSGYHEEVSIFSRAEHDVLNKILHLSLEGGLHSSDFKVEKREDKLIP